MGARRVTVAVGALLALSAWTSPAGAAAPEVPPLPAAASASELAGTGAELRVARAELLTRIATLTDEAEGAHARLVAAQEREAVAEAGAAHAGQALAEHAVDAFVHSSALTTAARLRGGLFAEVVGGVDRAVVDEVAAAAASAAAGRVAAEAALAEAARGAAAVEGARQALESSIEVVDRRAAVARAEEDRNALARRVAEEEQARQDDERVRQEALRAQEAALLADQARGGPGPPSSGAAAPGLPEGDPRGRGAGGTDPEVGAPAVGTGTGRSPDRVRRATAAEADLMARHRFGPVTDVPAGGSRTGQVVDGMASWYGPGFDGRPTASGALFDQQGWTVASRELPLGTVLLVTRGSRSVLVLVNDRGPFVPGRVLDLSRAVATELGTVEAGVAHVRAEVVRLP